MTAQFELYCEHIHCCGKKMLVLGEVETEKMAKKWIQDKTLLRKHPRLPKNDLIRTCPVIHCPAKLQTPRYNYRQKATILSPTPQKKR